MKEKETQYRREVLLKDPRFARYQPDFLAAVLNKPYYTLAEVQAAVKDFWKEWEERLFQNHRFRQ